MKKFIYPVIAMGFLMLASCSSSDDSGDMDAMDDDPMAGPVTYEANIRSIVSSNCLVCHGDPTANGAPMMLTTFALVKDAIDNRGLIGRVNSSTNPMPPTGRLPSGTRQLFQDWVDQGTPEN